MELLRGGPPKPGKGKDGRLKANKKSKHGRKPGPRPRPKKKRK